MFVYWYSTNTNTPIIIRHRTVPITAIPAIIPGGCESLKKKLYEIFSNTVDIQLGSVLLGSTVSNALTGLA